MSAPYTYQQPAQPPPQQQSVYYPQQAYPPQQPAAQQPAKPKPSFDIDELFGTSSSSASAPPPPPPPPGPPSPLRAQDDPFGFSNQQRHVAPQPQYQQPSLPPQPTQVAQPPPQYGYGYPVAGQPLQHQPPVAPIQQQAPPVQQQPPPHAGYPAQHTAVPQSQPYPQAPYTYAPPAQEPVPPPAHMDRQGSSSAYLGAFAVPGHQQPAPQQAPVAAYPAHASSAPPYGGAPAGAYPHGVAPLQPQPLHSSTPPPVPAVPSPGYSSTYSEEQDLANLERIRKLRQQLEQEQAAEAAASGSPKPGSNANASTTSPLAATSSSGGGWSCASCTFKNKSSTTKCEVCDSARPGFAKGAIPSSSAAQSGRPSAATVGGGSWTCEMCQGGNDGGSICRICNSPRPNAPAAVPPSAAGGSDAPLPPNVWACKNCTLHNPNAVTKCQACAYAKPGSPPVNRGLGSTTSTAAGTVVNASPVSMPSNWSCPTCTFENAVKDTKCGMCETAMPQSVADRMRQAQEAQAQAELPAMVVNGRRLTPAEQQKLVAQQQALLDQIQGRASAAGGGGARGVTIQSPPSHATAADEDSDDDEENIQWQKDSDAKRCNKCDAGFGLVVRRHHCRMCGFVFCKNCCNNWIKLKGPKEERVCADCYKEKTTPAPVKPATKKPTTSTTPPPPAPVSAPTTRPRVKCDCAAADEGFHRPGCPNNRTSTSAARDVDYYDF